MVKVKPNQNFNHRQQLGETSSKSNMTLRSYDSDKEFGTTWNIHNFSWNIRNFIRKIA